ncbi:hypothetical protein EYF80_038660 [Liparis tanakae]|uniref:Uncharacterized protein n=1 Tax=Liparis tanakae TaxID=230148 RepID=A0A4Z2GCN7_9TELE|nr:hypothetical protein EYF80_038660 [Liparis tanakae]
MDWHERHEDELCRGEARREPAGGEEPRADSQVPGASDEAPDCRGEVVEEEVEEEEVVES